MATATTRIERRETTPAEQQAEALVELLGAVAQQKEALLTLFDIIGELHNAGLLQIVQGLLKGRQEIGVIGISQLNKSGAQNLIKNAMTAVQFMGSIDPAHLKEVLTAVGHGLEQMKPAEERVNLWSMVNNVRDPDVMTSLGVMMNFLRGMGEALPSHRAEPPM
ncbi:MAG TPA: DUF1641 domain-containing protein [Symbiobacteriaceae bacterium]|nr:DUF1641 domain-containing protein [Symbiobacteriaceae bacterium]